MDVFWVQPMVGFLRILQNRGLKQPNYKKGSLGKKNIDFEIQGLDMTNLMLVWKISSNNCLPVTYMNN